MARRMVQRVVVATGAAVHSIDNLVEMSGAARFAVAKRVHGTAGRSKMERDRWHPLGR